MDNNLQTDSFISFIKKAQKQELSELQTRLETEYKIKKEYYKKEIETLKEKHESEIKIFEKTAEDRKKYVEMKSNKFTEMNIKEEIAKKYYFDYIDKKLRSKTFKEKWLMEGKSKIKGLKGKTKTLENGFVFENDNVYFEFTKENYFEKVYLENKNRIFKALFNK